MSISQAIDFILGGSGTVRQSAPSLLDVRKRDSAQKLDAALARHSQAVAKNIQTSVLLGTTTRACAASLNDAVEKLKKCPRNKQKCPYGRECPDYDNCPFDHSDDSEGQLP